jgi:hypothetical protein
MLTYDPAKLLDSDALVAPREVMLTYADVC